MTKKSGIFQVWPALLKTCCKPTLNIPHHALSLFSILSHHSPTYTLYLLPPFLFFFLLPDQRQAALLPLRGLFAARRHTDRRQQRQHLRLGPPNALARHRPRPLKDPRGMKEKNRICCGSQLLLLAWFGCYCYDAEGVNLRHGVSF